MNPQPQIKVFDILRAHRVPFVIVGGHAVNYHGYVRTTEDSDVIWLRSPESENALLGALTEIGAQWTGKDIDPETGIERARPVTLAYIRCEHLMMLFTTAGFLDLFDYIPGFPTLDVQEIYRTGVPGDDGFRYVSLKWLRQMKQVSGRSKDLNDLANLPPEPLDDQTSI